MEFFQARSLSTSILGGSKGDAAMGGFARFAMMLCAAFKQRLGGDAAAIEANAAESFVLLDQNDFFAEVGGVKRRGITARPAAHNTISVLIGSMCKSDLRSCDRSTASRQFFVEVFERLHQDPP